MATLLQSFIRRDIPVLPAKRLVAIDPGSRVVKILVVEEVFGRVRVLASERLDLSEGAGSGGAGDVRRMVPERLRRQGTHPVALALPHYRALSQVIDLPPSDVADVRRLIEEETVKLSGLDESTIVHDYVSLEPFGRHTNPFWVTLCREAEIQAQIDRCGLGEFDLCEVTTTANALSAAYQAAARRSDDAVVVDLGASGTTVVMVNGGQAVDAATFPIGGDAFTEALAADRGLTFDVAESLKRSEAFPADSKDLPRLTKSVDEWLAEFRRILHEWTEEHPGLVMSPEAFPVVMGGGASDWRGFLGQLERRGAMRFESWPQDEGCPVPADEAVAFGTAIQALGKARQPASLLPPEVRLFWRRQHSVALLHWLIVCMLGLISLLLVLVTWQRWAEWSSKQTLMTNIRSALGMTITTGNLSRQLAADYDRLRPVLARQQQTVDTLRTLALLQTVRSNQNFWYVLFADHQSYQAARPWGATNPVGVPLILATNPAQATLSAARGFIVELCVPEEGDAQRRTLSGVVAELKQSRLFTNVDSLSVDRRRNLVDPQVLLPEKHFSLNLELEGGGLARPVTPPDRRRAPATAPAEARSFLRASGATNAPARTD